MRAGLLIPLPPTLIPVVFECSREALAAMMAAAAQAFYLFAPLLASAALGGLVMRRNWLARWDRPLDSGAKLAGRRWLGDGKTWRGLMLAVTGACLGVALQRAVSAHVPAALQLVDYAHVQPLALGTALGLGAVLGELPNSFVKRRLGIARGKTATGALGVLFFIWDQVDMVLGPWPLLCWWVHPTPRLVAASLAVALVLHPLVAWLGYRLGARATAR